MMKRYAWQIAGMTAIGLALVFVLSAVVEKEHTPEVPRQEATQTNVVSISIEGLYASTSVSVFSGESVLDLLKALNAGDQQIELETKDYAGLGVLVESMVGKKNGTNNRYWQYKVNGVMPQVGADAYGLQNGDTVQWYFASSEF